MSDEEKIGPTAHYTAYAWKRLGLSYSELFATPRGRALYWAFRGAGEWAARATPGTPLLVDVLRYRHVTIDRAVGELAPDRVIELGAGLSRRGVASVIDGGVGRYLELDLPHMVAAKERAISRAPSRVRDAIAGKLELRAQDLLAPGLGAMLAGELRGAERAAVIAEGVLGYFDLDARAGLVRAIAEGLRAARRGVFLCDLRDQERSRDVGGAVTVLRGAVHLVTRGRGLREDFASERDIRAFFAEHGLPDARTIEPTPELARRRLPTRIWRASP